MSETVKDWHKAESDLFFSVLDDLLKRGIKPGALTVASVQCQAMQYQPPPPKRDADGEPVDPADDDLTFASAG